MREGEQVAGYIKLYRDIQEHWIWQDKPFSKGQAWIDLLMTANHDENKVVLGNKIILVERGCLITSEVKLAKRWGWSRCKVRTFLELLVNDGMIDKKSDSKKTYLKILNYNVWQDSETTKKHQKDSVHTAFRQHLDTNKNDKNEKNDKNNKNNIFIPPTLEEVTAYCRERNNNVDAQRWYDFYSAKGWMIGKNKMKDWKAAVRTWEKSSTSKQIKSKSTNPFLELAREEGLL